MIDELKLGTDHGRVDSVIFGARGVDERQFGS